MRVLPVNGRSEKTPYIFNMLFIMGKTRDKRYQDQAVSFSKPYHHKPAVFKETWARSLFKSLNLHVKIYLTSIQITVSREYGVHLVKIGEM